jgi:hypothetical protein
MNQRMHVSLCALFATFAAPLAAAQISNPTFTHEVALPWDEVAFGAHGTITRLVSGDFTGDLRPDVFARGGTAGSDVLFIYAAAQGSGIVKLLQSANDFDVAVGDGPAGRDVLYIAAPDGLRRMIYVGTSETVPFSSEQPLTGNWYNAKLVRCGNVNGTGGVDLVGLTSDPTRKTVVYRRDNGTETTFTVASPILDIQLLHWGSGSTLQAALLMENGVRMYTLETGLPADVLIPDYGIPGGSITVVHQGTNGPDRLMWTLHSDTSHTVLRQLRRNDPDKIDYEFELPRNDVVSLATGASNGPLFGENLLVSFEGTYSPLQFTNQATATGAPLFEMAHSQSVTWTIMETFPPVTPLPNHATAIYRDLDNDGLSDLVLPMTTSGGATFEILSSGPAGPGQRFDGAQFYLGDVFPVLDMGTSVYEFSFKFQSVQYNTAEFVVWRNEGTSTDLQAKAMYRYLVPLPQSVEKMRVTGIAFLDPVDPFDTCGPDVRWLEVRQLELDPQGNPVATGPTYACAVAGGDTGEALWPGAGGGYPYFQVYDESAAALLCLTDNSFPLSELTKRRRATPPSGSTATLPGSLSEGAVITTY